MKRANNRQRMTCLWAVPGLGAGWLLTGAANDAEQVAGGSDGN
jgi:hypothetical protein